MSLRMIPLKEIPYSEREFEADARRDWQNQNQNATRADMARAAKYEIVEAPGTYSGAFPATIGWTLTRAAADAITDQLCHMPGGTSHRLYHCEQLSE